MKKEIEWISQMKGKIQICHFQMMELNIIDLIKEKLKNIRKI